MDATESFVGINELATRLDLPAAWLLAEARAGRLPAIAAGRSMRFDLPLVREALIERAKANTAQPTEAAR